MAKVYGENNRFADFIFILILSHGSNRDLQNI